MKVQHFADIKVGFFGKRIGFLFDMYAWLNLWQNKGIDSGLGVNEVIYFAYVSWCKDTGKRAKLSGEQLVKLIESAPSKEVENIKRVLAESTKDLQKIKESAESMLKKK